MKCNIKYSIILTDRYIQNKEIIVKNCTSKKNAEQKLEKYLKSKYESFSALIVIGCTEVIKNKNTGNPINNKNNESGEVSNFLEEEFRKVFGDKFNNIFGDKD